MSNELNFEQFIGKKGNPRSMHYTWRDISLYALSIGASEKDLPLIYERHPQYHVFPTFGLIPYLNAIMIDPPVREPNAPNEWVRSYVIEKLGYVPNCLHMGLELSIHNQIDPYEGTLLIEDKLENVYDRGEGKGIVAKAQMDIYNNAGLPVYTLKSNHYIGAYGGFGGPKFDSGKIAFPDRAPDYEISEYMADNLAAIYRLMGDTAPVHLDPAVSSGFGYEKPFMQGLATYGFAVRMGVKAAGVENTDCITRLNVQMRAVTYPGQKVTFQGWNIGPGAVGFKLKDEAGKALLDNGVIEYNAG